ncbi:imidazole glycerol phosphate synthase subunit hisF [Pseudomonas mohnii]
MSGNSLASLLAWMKDNTRMLGWGLVVALERRKTNLIVLQEYIKRFSENSYLPPIRGEVEIVAGRRMEVIHDYVMNVPVLSFENANLNDSKAMLTMTVAGGSQLTMERDSVGWKVYKVDDIDPLQGPKLHLNLLLNEVPGNVDGDGRVKLDLSKSDGFFLTFAESEHEQRLGGEFFKDLFNQLPDEKRVYALGKIERGTNDLIRPQSFELRTQANGMAARDPHSAEYGDGAVLAFIRMEKRLGGDFPGEGYRYLIPDDQGKDYSATVLFDRERVQTMTVLNAVQEMFGSSEFSYEFSQAGNVTRATLSVGKLVLPKIEEKEVIEVPVHGLLEFGMTVDELTFLVSTENPVVVDIEARKAVVSWSSTATGRIMFITGGREGGSFIGDFGMGVVAEYELVEHENEAVLRRTAFELTPDFAYRYPEEKGDDTDPDFWRAIALILFHGLIMPFVYGLRAPELIKYYFSEQLNAVSPLGQTIQNIIKLNFGQAIQGDEVYAPHDIGFFGRINPAQTSFVINPMQPLMKQGGSQQFATVPVVAGVQWKVENLVDGPGSPGTISASGLYQAPPASAIKGRFTRVRVTATAPGSGYHSSALVTVLLNELSVNPLIQICDVGTTAEFAAGSLGGDRLQWSIKNPVPGESGEIRPSVKPGGDHTYHHGPVNLNKTYLLDEIEVKNTRTNETRSVHVLALQKLPALTINIVSADIAQGKVQLEAILNGKTLGDAVWSLPQGGPGSISQTGLYQAPQTATERYVVIFALLDDVLYGKFEGHLILPLPLVEFPQVLGLPG